MTRLLSDREVADQINMSVKQLQNLRSLDRGDNLGRIPAWVDQPGMRRKRVRGTTQESVDAWIARNTVGRPAA